MGTLVAASAPIRSRFNSHSHTHTHNIQMKKGHVLEEKEIFLQHPNKKKRTQTNSRKPTGAFPVLLKCFQLISCENEKHIWQTSPANHSRRAQPRSASELIHSEEDKLQSGEQQIHQNQHLNKMRKDKNEYNPSEHKSSSAHESDLGRSHIAIVSLKTGKFSVKIWKRVSPEKRTQTTVWRNTWKCCRAVRPNYLEAWHNERFSDHHRYKSNEQTFNHDKQKSVCLVNEDMKNHE